MPDIVFWPLFITFAAATVAAIYKTVEALHSKKLSDDECLRLRGQLEVLNDSKNTKALNHQPVEVPAINQAAEHDKSVTNPDRDIFHSILAFVAKYHSQNIEATPTRIAVDLSLDPEVTLAYMWKYHNEQFITFTNGGKKPDLDTPFFLSPNAWHHIKVVCV